MSTMALLEHRLRAARPHERDAAMAVIVAAFEADPAARALYPSPSAYARHFPPFVDAFGGTAFTGGVVDISSDGMGAALWFPPGVDTDPEPLFAHVENTVAPESLPAILAGLRLQGALHPHEPHWYLPFIGVRPEAQGAGLGAALLRHGLARADADRLPAYLEATSRHSARLYRRHGFEVIGIVEAAGYPEIIAMWRPGG